MRAYVMASIMIIIGLLSIAYKGSIGVQDWKYPYLSELSSALLVGGILSLLFKIFQEKETENTLRRLLRIHDSVDELGLKQILPEAQGYNFTRIIDSAGTLSIVMNDGLRWVGNNTVALQDRFSKEGVTEFFTVDPNSSFIESLAAKTALTSDELKKKIQDSWKRLEETYNASSRIGVLRLYRLKTYPTRSFFLSEDTLVETPYQTASGRAKIPVYEYGKVTRRDAPFFFAQHDIEAIRKEAILEKEFKKT
jgi:hypothetical protein